MEFLTTPEHCFEQIVDFDYAPHFLRVDDYEGSSLKLHYIDEGPRDANVVLMLHGEPSWSYLYRKMIGPVVEAGYRVIAPDLIGFGKSDKPTERSDYTYQRHLDWIRQVIIQLDLKNITLVCQDWGGLLGLRLVAEHLDLFSRVLAANTMLPTGDHKPNEAFLNWQTFSQEVAVFPVAGIIKGATVTPLGSEVLAAYDAPFPDETYKAGVRQFPLLVPTTPNDPASEANRLAWQTLRQFTKPFITAFSDSDPVTAGGDKIMQKLIPGCQGQAHAVIQQGGHFLQEDQGKRLAAVLLTFMSSNPL
ncbi:MAG: haloalkane dehalogenase [Paraglaciecola sp.]|uniref:haloalkane dehalogenase n=1 Tax=uncultured Paraglaciecola sp. TaxID=1765024 RepID=UPI0025EB44E2|nr:haloalkane dehalogenase [uncultured Paraglaciecola sp.]